MAERNEEAGREHLCVRETMQLEETTHSADDDIPGKERHATYRMPRSMSWSAVLVGPARSSSLFCAASASRDVECSRLLGGLAARWRTTIRWEHQSRNGNLGEGQVGEREELGLGWEKEDLPCKSICAESLSSSGAFVLLLTFCAS